MVFLSLRFKATLWLSEAHPLSLAEQVTPIIDLMAISNAHFAKLRDFITLRLPPGFPVKIGGKKCHIDHFIPLCDQNLAIYFLKGIVHPKIVIVLLEIPLFHVLNARVTFSNLCGCDEPVSSVTVQSPQGATEAGKHLLKSKVALTVTVPGIYPHLNAFRSDTSPSAV